MTRRSRTRPPHDNQTPRTPAEAAAAPADTLDDPTGTFPIVGIGASAGGVEAMTGLLKALPDTGMAFVFVQHLDPRRNSLLAEIFGRMTTMTVVEASDGRRVEPHHLFIIPPNCDLGISHGALRVLPRREESRPHLPVDFFLRELAADQGPNAVAIILSGTGSDGALGLEFIKAQGGITFVQRADSAKYDGMPEAALATGCVDFALDTAGIAGELQRLTRHPYLRARPPAGMQNVLPVGGDQLGEVFRLLLSQTRMDFTSYKGTTIARRIARRLALHELHDLSDYLPLLRANPTEVKALSQDLLIPVTNFFRDPEVFDALKREVFPHLLEHAAPGEPLRVWVPGCSTGEEAYSLAITWAEFVESADSNVLLQIFATDVNASAIERARLGHYGENIQLDVSRERIRRFFVASSAGGFQVSKALRDICLFARQDLLRDPPFSQLDVVSCRNVLIYFEPVLQRKVAPIFHFGLKPHGVLVLGASESIGAFADLFGTLNEKHRFYVKRQLASGPRLEIPPTERVGSDVAPARVEAVARGNADVKRSAELALLARLPPSVLVDDAFRVVVVRGHTGDYLELAQGATSSDVFKMAREGLLQPLRTALDRARKTGAAVSRNAVTVSVRGRSRLVNLKVVPVTTPGGAARHYLILFEAAPRGSRPKPSTGAAPRKSTAIDRHVGRLRQELKATREYLQVGVEEQETTNAQLRSLNEEILSSNEELKSANEEMQTAREELQSTNEELKTANVELQTRNQQLAEAEAQVVAMVDHFSKAVVVLTADLRVMRANRAFYEMFHATAADTEGQMIWDLGTGQWNIPALRLLLERILPAKTELRDFEVIAEFPAIGRRDVLLDAHLTTWGQEHTPMILLAFEDITRRKESEAAREATITLLGLLNQAGGLEEAVRCLLVFLEQQSGCEAVGVRLRNGDDFTYFDARGFSPDFILADTGVCTIDAAGNVVRDASGNPVLECLCGRVLAGRVNPARPYFTPKGSFWTNSTTALLADTTAGELGLTRGRCVSEGYESLALIPLRVGAETVGLLQLTDRRIDRFTPVAITLIETLADHVAASLAHRSAAGALRRIEERLRLAADAAQLGAWEFDPATRRIDWDDRCQAMLAVPPGAPSSYDAFEERLHPDDRARVAAQVQDALDPGGSGQYATEYRVITADGSVRWIAARGRGYFEGESGARRAVRMAGTVMDITAQKQDEASRREADERFQLAIESAGIGTWEYDLVSGRMVFSERSQAMLGTARASDAPYESFLGRIDPRDVDRVNELVQHACDPAGSGDYEAEFRVRGPDAPTHWISAKGRAHFAGAGSQRRAVRLAGIARDVTEHRRAEERERLLAVEIAANRAKDDFIATLSHEMRNPLNAILGWASLLQSGRLDATKSARALDIVVQNARSQAQLINDLLDVSHIVRGTYEIEPVQFELRSVVQEALEALKPAADAKHIHLEGVLEDVGTVLGDQVRLQQLVWNLLQNAVKFTTQGGRVEVRLAGASRPDVPRGCEITVSDTGIGIRPDFLPYVFDRFRQADSAVTRRAGLGLGLALVRHIAELHGGTIEARSAGERQGATFIVYLPIQAVGVVTTAPAPIRETPSLDGLRILVVDDLPEAREWLRTVLTLANADVRVATGATDALALVGEWRPHVLVSDIGLPDQDGYRLIKAVRALPTEEGGQTPALALTAYARTEDRQQALESGYQAHMVKPADEGDVVRTIATLAGLGQTT